MSKDEKGRYVSIYNVLVINNIYFIHKYFKTRKSINVFLYTEKSITNSK